MVNESEYTDEFLQANDALEKEDYKKAFYFLKKGALKHDVNCYNNLGMLYDLGYGVKRNFNSALYWYKKSWRYEGKTGGVSSNIASLYASEGNVKRAKFWWNKAILELGDGDAALDYAKFLIKNNNSKNNNKIIELLNFVINSSYVTELSKEEANDLLEDLNSKP
ncbi:tetratricopeptide repeat protein [Neisseria zalophi]|uniref:Sel1 repeat family protein n=1 Tax=Neisseria zalophi TaxID=640030 RepID=A0A5J6Q2J2_9NEIS|nr:SEL1-like repeat protein [Neisseria zalophi]QEY27177.1 sel1 repeat family protein [Neisseria zalophi]